MSKASEILKFQEMFGFWINLLVGGSFLIFGLVAGGPGYLFAVIGLLLVIFTEIETITFDKNLGHLTLKKEKPLISKTKTVKHLIEDISGVEIQKIEDSESVKYRVCLVLFSGKRSVPLTSYFSTGLGDKHKKAEVIATFLDIKNYGLEGFPRQQSYSEELQWETIEEEIVHWETAIASDSNDADAHLKLAIALLSQDKTKNKEQAISHIREAEALFKSQGYDEEAMQAGQLYGMLYWGMLGK
ncbi:MAG: hypothetical protein JGK17_26725 [Microcoleus sp. PH2017_10_PVI_O_A]|uniref:hypothetical protein n=1 Tax=unclassified Microcoleus TaxID=2642155 RepID=UPI001DD6E6E0|nr:MULTISPECIES: hypothetical protein [unclassified Microcoleus]TAE84553.1 MAG: hypothetical protein EAZ83_06290 [Oscillatoriales cyanobacterium]MCC3409099.1 hypothetical protein [Microcoleus sp. PH2017_10_PVI_O_A]MCC3463217.1 hypothetical protein [Microcoleus sp. PH2017_11_PCY_U_A]MCC3481638.1 hypothetical protein [Microcoleus sp. PH2017_12_PCY_D_A]MCC3562555.1 hypothetical protein [Microcoleus sp. PH2017_27_LUM_O_A]